MICLLWSLSRICKGRWGDRDAVTARGGGGTNLLDLSTVAAAMIKAANRLRWPAVIGCTG
ncbi:hypothetical protein [Nocardia sp. NPDC052566]|uniref:hypothetical protein n=1 Tax=Nocardia sp. NPDC052566 TaxID=3364330 RepID=UPI0037CC8C58